MNKTKTRLVFKRFCKFSLLLKACSSVLQKFFSTCEKIIIKSSLTSSKVWTSLNILTPDKVKLKILQIIDLVNGGKIRVIFLTNKCSLSRSLCIKRCLHFSEKKLVDTLITEQIMRSVVPRPRRLTPTPSQGPHHR